ncbi:MAG: hypothetical protein ACK56F_24905, partial [bacterium]
RQQKQKTKKSPETAEESKQATQPVKDPRIPIDNVPNTIPADKKRGRGRPSLKEKIAKSNTKMDQFYRRKVVAEQPALKSPLLSPFGTFGTNQDQAMTDVSIVDIP